MKRFDRFGSLICLIIAALVIWQSAIIPMGSTGKPGPGFLPFWVGVILALLSGFLWFEAGGRQSVVGEAKFLSREGRWPNVVWTGILLVGYGFLIEIMGFLICTLLFLVFLFRFIGSQKWWVAIMGSALVTLISHAIFKLALKVQLPVGLLKI